MALALSGGGAAAIGQIPVLEALDEMDVEIVAISGTSMGAILGALRAAGYSGGDIRDLITKQADDLPSTGWHVLRGLSVMEDGGGLVPDPLHLVGELMPEEVPELIEDLLIPVSVLATDFYAQKRHSFDRGPLRPALAASFAIPGALRPVRIDDRIYVDGGVSDNLPVSDLKGSDPILAVDAATDAPVDSGDIPGPLECSMGSMRIMMRALLEARLGHATPEILIRPASSGFGPLEFHRIPEILEAAEPVRDETRQAISQLFG